MAMSKSRSLTLPQVAVFRLARLAAFVVTASCLPLIGSPSPASASEKLDAVGVVVDQAKLIRLPEKTHTVIVGNPMIADITVQRNGILIVTGKSFGVTNFIALDAAGAMLAESQVTVRASRDKVLTVHRGLERESYSCSPECLPSIQLGDAPRFFGDIGGQATTRSQMSAPR
jgi:Flp pilus assembly secretin CpaC